MQQRTKTLALIARQTAIQSTGIVAPRRVDLSEEEKVLVMQLEFKGKKAWLRVFPSRQKGIFTSLNMQQQLSYPVRSIRKSNGLLLQGMLIL